jgi:hypothetical protein
MGKSHNDNIMEKTKELKHPFTAQEIYILLQMDKGIKHKPPFRKVVDTLYRSELERTSKNGIYKYNWRDNHDQ